MILGELAMKKFFFFPLWKIENLEGKLSKLEQNGWRLDRLSPFNCFHFVEATAKDTSYFFTYKLIKENGMADIEHFLKSKHNANPVRGTPAASILHSVYVYRIVSCANLEKPRFYRNIYLQHLVFQKILLGIFMPILCSLLLTFQLISGGLPAEDIPQWIFLGFLVLLSLAYCGYQFYGLCHLKQQYKKMLQHISISYDDLLS